MTDPERLAHELDDVFTGTPWHADALMTILATVSTEQVAWRPLAGVHSIGELVEHLIFWKRVIHDRLGGQPVADADDRDWQGTVSARDWTARLESLRAAHESLLVRVRSLTPADLDAIVPGKTIPVREMVHGASYHDAYHAGQIRLLQRLYEEVH